MNAWIFQGDPDRFDIDGYLASRDDILWTIDQAHFRDLIEPGDQVFLWRAAGKKKLLTGVVAAGVVTDRGRTRAEPPEDATLGSAPRESQELRVGLRLWKRCLNPKRVIRRGWLEEDPLLSNLRILSVPRESTFRLSPAEAQRITALVRRTGEDWTRGESVAGLWAYHETAGGPVSKLPDTPVSRVALMIGRSVSSVYRKVANFRSLDPRDPRKGLKGASKIDREVWNAFYDPENGILRADELATEVVRLLNSSGIGAWAHLNGEVVPLPGNDPEELQTFAARVRRGQPKFRAGLEVRYEGKCAVTGHGPTEVLEAVHILDHAATGLNEWDNGLLLRADLHHLFDRGLMRVHPRDLTVHFDESLQDSPYWQFHCRPLRSRTDGSRPSQAYLSTRWHKGG